MKKTEDQKRQASRRKLLKSILAGGGVAVAGRGLPEQWTKPVVDAVLLPAHAQTTCGGITSYAGGVILSTTSVEVNNSPVEKLLDLVVPRALAQPAPTTATAELCIQCNGDGTVDVRVLFTVDFDGEVTLTPYFTGNNIPLGQVRTLTQQNTCPEPFSFGSSIVVNSLNATAVGTLNLNANDGQILVSFAGGFGIGEGACPIPTSPGCGVLTD